MFIIQTNLKNKLISLYRIIRNGFQNFFRNGLLSFATVSVMTLTLFSISIIVLINIITNEAITTIQKSIDLTIQLNSELTDSEIEYFISDIKKNELIESYEYKSKQEALDDFKLRFRDRSDIITFLDRLGRNPLYPSVIIISKDPAEYQTLITKFESQEYQKYVKGIKGKDDQTERLKRLFSITDAIKKFLWTLILGFSFIALLIIINTVRVTIYTRKTEIMIMKLVGATHAFISLPFHIEGMLYGIFATILSSLLFFPIVHHSSPFLAQFFDTSRSTILTYYLENLTIIVLWQLLIGVSVGIISANLAVSRYLKR